MRIGFVAVAVLVTLTPAAFGSHTTTPSSVVVPGSLQSELGCPGDWQPDCSSTGLVFDAEDDAWQALFDVPAGNWEYKAALNGSWDENYGAGAERNGPNIALNLASDTAVKFYYDHDTHWITSNRNSVIVTAPGSFQSEIGCAGDWSPDCLRSWLQDPDGDGIYRLSVNIPSGSYEVKAAINESWDENYGAGGVRNGPNIGFTVSGSCSGIEFVYDAASHVLTVAGAAAAPQPSSVTIAGSLQSELGCPGDWQPECAATHLSFDAVDGVWQGTFAVPAGNWEYKAPLNDSWDENYGLNATRNGANIALPLADASSVKFYYDHGTHWITDNRTEVIATAPGSFQSELGCSGDWQPDCLRSWLQDPDGDGIYTFSTRALPAGNYETKVAIDESWNENYGAGGAPNGANIAFSVPAECTEIFFSYDAATHILTVSAAGAPRGNIGRAQAHWLTEDTIGWNVPATSNVSLHFSDTAGLQLVTEGVTGGTDIALTHDPAGLDAATRAKFPHLAGLTAWRFPSTSLGDVPAALRGQLAVSAKDDGGAVVDATALQIAGVLDDLYTYDGPLGATISGGTTTFRLWAPTAQSVTLVAGTTTHAMTFDAATGVWSHSGPIAAGTYYHYEVDVFTRATGNIEHNRVTDPYSLSLSRNSGRSQVVDLSSRALKPAGWDSLVKPRLDAPEDIALYELHVRDFSAADASVPAPLRGTFKAFTQASSNGMRHLASLAAGGMTHVHLLPAFDIASVDEDKNTWLDPGDLSIHAPASDQQQAAVMAIASRDAFNWGYDPWHYTVPDGSYATDAEGTARIVEFREMVQGLAGAGLRTVMDVVYNHTSSSGQNDKSVLDKIVPGYYHRLNADGDVERSTCCENTASEHNMMEKLLIDSVLTWATEYKVDGFRFDLMGHHMKRNMTKLRAALDALTPERDGVDGRAIYLYGEGWNFGEVANGARGENAIQSSMAGTGIGSFSDRLRDGVRGGGPFSGLQEQGFVSGLYSDPNHTDQGSSFDQLQTLLHRTDWIRLGMAGNLATFRFVNASGATIEGRQLDYNGQQAGYTADPQETINYIEAHDNETLFDALQLKLPLTLSMAQRVRAQNLGVSIVGLAQGIPFFHAGMELLRSKSLDRNSYNSGDWFNRLDFTYQSNNWGVGLPPAPDNSANWPLFATLLSDGALRPAPAHIGDAAAHMRETLAIRRSTRLFRLRTAEEIRTHVRSLNGGPNPVPGLIVMEMTDATGTVDRQRDLVVALINATPSTVSFSGGHAGKALQLHPVQVVSNDPLVRTSSFDPASGAFQIPGRTAAVFWSARAVDAQVGLLKGDVDRLVSGNAQSLHSKLDAAIESIAHGNRNAAANQLKAFIQQVEALVRSGRMPADAGDALIQEANAIIAQL